MYILLCYSHKVVLYLGPGSLLKINQTSSAILSVSTLELATPSFVLATTLESRGGPDQLEISYHVIGNATVGKF